MKTDWKKGDFAVRNGMLCRFFEDVVNGAVHVELVADYEGGAGICCGGYTMGGGLAGFRQVTSAEHIILSRAYAALKAKEAAEKAAIDHGQEFRVQSAALKALKDAQRAASELLKQMTEAVVGDPEGGEA